MDDAVLQPRIALDAPKCGDAPVVSVIMPVYNGARWLAAAVESVLAQTLTNLEVLIVDDASQDATWEIAQRFSRLDARVQVLHHRVNRGQAAARNLALSQARGDWVAPVDADDQIRPDRLRRLVEAGEREGADLIADGILFAGERQPGVPAELMHWRRNDQRLEQLSAEALIRSGFGGGCRSLGYLKPLIRRRFLERGQLRYAEDLRFAEDFNLYARALFCGARFLLYPESHYVYWQTPESASRTGISQIAQDAVENSQMLRLAVPATDSAEVTAALDEYERRWQVLSWFDQMKRGCSERDVSKVFGVLARMPVSARDIVRFAFGRMRMKRRALQDLD